MAYGKGEDLNSMHCPQCQQELQAFGKFWICLEHGQVQVGELPQSGPEGTGGATQPKPKVFISYGRHDARDLADRLSGDLSAEGYEVWQDVREIRPGTLWEREIQDGLRSTQVVVAVLSPHAVRVAAGRAEAHDSDSVCLDELSYARFARPPTPIVPVMAIPCEPPFCIFRLDYVDLCDWKSSAEQYQAGFQRLLHGIEQTLRGETRYRSWEHQLQPWDFAAFLHAKRQHFCGREWLFDELNAWRVGRAEERALLITGDPGSGKSAIVAELVHRNPAGQVMAYHCCQANARETLKPARFVRSLAAMMASRLDAYAAQLETPSVRSALDPLHCEEDPGSSLDEGVLAPLERLPAPEDGARLILIDALDEALLHRGSPNIVEVLASRIERLPGWLRLVATTRREPDVLNRLSVLRGKHLDAHDPRNLQDLARYVRARLANSDLAESLAASRVTGEQAAEALIEQSGGNFLYVQQALEGLTRNQYRFDQLRALPPGLEGIYQSVFETRFPDEQSYAPARRLLEVVLAAQQPLTAEQLEVATGLDWGEGLAPLLRKLAAYAPEQTDPEGIPCYALYHRSLADWLVDARRGLSRFSVSITRGHERLADACWREYERSPRDLGRYGLAHLATHLLAAQGWDRVISLLTDLQFVEAKAAAGMVADLQRDYHAAWDILPDSCEARDRQRRREREWTHYGLQLAQYARDWRALPCRETLAGSSERMPAAAGVPLPSLPEPPEGRGPLEIAPGSHADGPLASQGWEALASYAAYVSTHGHLLAEFPRETAVLARNQAASGTLAEQAEILLRSQRGVWVARESRPASPPLRPACVRTLRGHVGWVYTVIVTPDGTRAISSGRDGTLRVWDLASGSELSTLSAHARSATSVAMTPDGKTVVSASTDQTVVVWDLPSRQRRWTLHGHRHTVSGAAVTADGARAVSASNDGTLVVWNLEQGESVRTLRGHQGPVTCVALTPEGRTMISGGEDRTLRLWDASAGQLRAVLSGHMDIVRSVALTPDATFAVSGSWDGTVRTWDLASGRETACLRGHTGWIYSVALTPDGRLAASAGSDLAVRVWDLTSRRLLRTFRGHADRVNSVALRPDGEAAVSASQDGTLRLWDMGGEEPGDAVASDRHERMVNSVAVAAAREVAVSAGDDYQVHVWDMATGLRTAALQGHRLEVYSIAISQDGSTAVSASRDRTLIVWDLQAGTARQVLEGHAHRVRCVAMTADGRTVISGSEDRTCRVWDLATGNTVAVLQGHVGTVAAVAIIDDARTALSAGGARVLMWDLETQQVLHALEGHDDLVSSVALASDGTTAVSASWDGTLRLWDLHRGRCLRVYRGHTAPVRSVSLSADGRTALSAGKDRTVRVWNLATGRELAIHVGGDPCCLSALREDRRFACGTRDGQVHVLTVRNRG